MAIKTLTAKNLYPRLLRKSLPFKSTDELDPLESVIGQNRALKALELGLEIDASGYNIFVTGLSGTGRTTIIENILKKYSEKNPVPDDWCYVFNFSDPDCPQALNLPAGKGKNFQQDMNWLINTLRHEIERVFTSEDYEKQRDDIINRGNKEKHQQVQALDDEAEQLGLKIQPTSMGFQTTVLKDGNPLSSEDFDKLPAEERRELSENVRFLEDKISETLRTLARLDIQTQQSIDKLNKDIASFVANQYVGEVKQTYQNYPQILSYLDRVAEEIVSNSHQFLKELDKNQHQEKTQSISGVFKKFKVNVVVDNSHLSGAPVIFETNPTYNNLFGRIEKRPLQGTYVTDFTMIKAGSLLKANGGYLMADASEVLSNPYVYDTLKRCLRNKEIRIEDIYESHGTISIASLKPQPIPLKLKAILIGWNRTYRLLHHYDDEFAKIFKIRANFDYETESTEQTVLQYAKFVKRVIDEKDLPPFHRDAIAEIIHYGHRLAGSQDKISLEFGEIIKVIQEAAFWAKKDGKQMVKAEHVLKALAEKEFRHSLSKEKIQDYIRRDIHKIITSGKTIGELNGLTIYNLSDYSFGKPTRITAKTYIGSESVVNIERKSGLTGKIHDKGSYILAGFFKSKFGDYIPLSFSASVAFEQSYGKIDGDSAASTELYALISSLADLPINQGIAVTGSVNQNGEVQAIGGVNEKIEGFFEVCKQKGLNGEQGVIIPKSNMAELVLPKEVRDAVEQGQFNIWAIDRVEDGLKILTGYKTGNRNQRGKFPKDSIYYKVEEKLRRFAIRSEDFRDSVGKDRKKKTQKKKSKDKKPPGNGKADSNPS